MRNEDKLWIIFGAVVLSGILLVSLGFFASMFWTLRDHFDKTSQQKVDPMPKEYVLDCVFDSTSKKTEVKMKCKEIK